MDGERGDGGVERSAEEVLLLPGLSNSVGKGAAAMVCANHHHPEHQTHGTNQRLRPMIYCRWPANSIRMCIDLASEKQRVYEGSREYWDGDGIADEECNEWERRAREGKEKIAEEWVGDGRDMASWSLGRKEGTNKFTHEHRRRPQAWERGGDKREEHLI